MNQKVQANSTHPIQVVVRRTGLTQDTLRAWEKRYGAVEPGRTPTGRRAYSDDDVERLLLLRRATMGGRSIGQVAKLPTVELRALVAEDDAQSATDDVAPAARRGRRPRKSGTTEEWLSKCLAAVEQLDHVELESVLESAHVALGGPALLEQVVLPLIQKVGERWRSGDFRVFQEHLVTAMLRTFLGNLCNSNRLPSGAPLLIVTTPSGQLHELGALVAATVAATEGWRVLYLGPNMPAQEIAAAAIQKEARAVALSLVYPTDKPHLRDELRTMRQHLPEHTVLLAGGRAAEELRQEITEAGCEVITDGQELRSRLESIRASH